MTTLKNHTGYDSPESRRFYGKPDKIIKHLRSSPVRTELDCVIADELERLIAELKAVKDALDGQDHYREQLRGMEGEISRLRRDLNTALCKLREQRDVERGIAVREVE